MRSDDCCDRNASTFYATRKNSYGRLDDFLETVEAENSRKDMLKKWTCKTEDGLRFMDPLENRRFGLLSDVRRAQILEAFGRYGRTLISGVDWFSGRYQIYDVARRLLAGTGSFGTPRYYVLVRDRERDRWHVLDVKRQQRPAGYMSLDPEEKAAYARHFGNGGRHD